MSSGTADVTMRDSLSGFCRSTSTHIGSGRHCANVASWLRKAMGVRCEARRHVVRRQDAGSRAGLLLAAARLRGAVLRQRAGEG